MHKHIHGGNYSNVTFTIQDQNNNDIEAVLLTYETQESQGSKWDVFLNSDLNMVNGNTYHIKMNYGNNYIVSEDIIISWYEEPTNVPSGTITNSSGETTGNIDLSGLENRIDLTNDLLTQQTQAILSGDKQLRDSIISGDNKIVGALTNTDFSGDITLESLPQVEIDDPSEDFFSWLLTNIEDVILYSGDTVLVIPIYNENYEIPSDVFKFTMEPLKSFISIGWWFVCGIPLLKWVRHTIETIRSGNIPQVDDKSDLLGNVL